MSYAGMVRFSKWLWLGYPKIRNLPFHKQQPNAYTRLEKQQRSDIHLSERLAFLGIMGSQLMTPQKPPYITDYRIEWLKKEAELCRITLQVSRAVNVSFSSLPTVFVVVR